MEKGRFSSLCAELKAPRTFLSGTQHPAPAEQLLNWNLYSFQTLASAKWPSCLRAGNLHTSVKQAGMTIAAHCLITSPGRTCCWRVLQFGDATEFGPVMWHTWLENGVRDVVPEELTKLQWNPGLLPDLGTGQELSALFCVNPSCCQAGCQMNGCQANWPCQF